MRVCIVGAGAIGGLLGVKLALTGSDLTLIARGPHLDAIKKNGLKLVTKDGSEYVARDLKATSSIYEAGPQDVVILAVKAHQIAAIAADLQTMCTPDTTVVTTQNGIPWWYFQRHGGEFDGATVDYRLRSKKGPWLVIDVTIEGVSLVSNYKDQFKEVLASGGPDLLIQKLREKNAAGETDEIS